MVIVVMKSMNIYNKYCKRIAENGYKRKKEAEMKNIIIRIVIK